MKCNILIVSSSTASRTICGAEIADSSQAAARTDAMNGYEYRCIDVTSVEEFINNYNQFYISGSTLKKSAGYDATIHRKINPSEFDRSFPYANDRLSHN